MAIKYDIFFSFTWNVEIGGFYWNSSEHLAFLLIKRKKWIKMYNFHQPTNAKPLIPRPIAVKLIFQRQQFRTAMQRNGVTQPV